MRKHLINLSGAAVIIWAGIANLFLVGYHICAECLPPVMMLMHFTPWLLGGTLLLVIVVIPLLFYFTWPRYVKVLLMLWLLPGIIFFFVWYGHLLLPPEAPAINSDEPVIRVATFNTQDGTDRPAADAVKVIEELDADIIGLQEVSMALRDRLKHELQREYPYRVFSPPAEFANNYALLSRYPILDYSIEQAEISGGGKNYLRAVLRVKGLPVVVYVTHPSLPRFHADSRNHQHMLYFTEAMRSETLPLVMLCDCNTTDRSEGYKQMDRYFDEAFGAIGWGFGLTYPAQFPLVRIDFIWYSDHFMAVEAGVGSSQGASDHRPLWAKLHLPA